VAILAFLAGALLVGVTLISTTRTVVAPRGNQDRLDSYAAGNRVLADPPSGCGEDRSARSPREGG
jgi:hypothetical protein